MSVTEALQQSLLVLQPTELLVTNESESHRGHAGYRKSGSGESHFFIHIASPRFLGLSLLEQHRLVHNCLGEELIHKIHALRLETKLPQSESPTT